MLNAILTGMALGMSLVMPVGQLNIFIFNNSSFQSRFVSIFPVVLMASLCDMLLILASVWCADLVALITWFKPVLATIGIIFLIYMGISMWYAAENCLVEAAVIPNLQTQLIYSASLSILNPHALMDTFIVIGGISSTFVGIEKTAFMGGCIFIDFFWFTTLGIFGYFIRQIPKGPKLLYFINRISSVMMLGLAVKLFIDFFI